MTDANSHKGLDGTPILTEALGMALETAPRKTLKVDIVKYQTFLDDPDLGDEQKEQIVQALWQIVLCFVDLGYGVSPLQDACGKLDKTEGFGGDQDQNMLRSDADTLTDTFNTFAAE